MVDEIIVVNMQIISTQCNTYVAIDEDGFFTYINTLPYGKNGLSFTCKSSVQEWPKSYQILKKLPFEYKKEAFKLNTNFKPKVKSVCGFFLLQHR